MYLEHAEGISFCKDRGLGALTPNPRQYLSFNPPIVLDINLLFPNSSPCSHIFLYLQSHLAFHIFLFLLPRAAAQLDHTGAHIMSGMIDGYFEELDEILAALAAGSGEGEIEEQVCNKQHHQNQQ
jgi:hypothetical protein